MNDTSSSNYEMLKALYDFEDTSSERTLNFKTHDEFFIYRDIADKKSWCLVINSNGDLGYVPYNYVKTIYVKDSHVLQFLENCIALVQKQIDNDDNSSERFKFYESLLRRQKKFKQKTLYDTLNTPIAFKSDDKCNQTEKLEEPHIKIKQITVPEVYEIVQQVRNHTGLSYNYSQVAVSVVVQYLSELVNKNVKSSLDSIRDIIDTFPPTSSVLPEKTLENTKDAQNMQQIFKYLSETKEDSQQRSWQVYDDHIQIENYLIELTNILKNADPMITNHLLKVDQFRSVNDLLDYYQMELRWVIQKHLLEVFTELCKLNFVTIDIILNSVLPMELARELQTNQDNKCKKILLAEFLTLILSTGETLSISCFDYMNFDFVTKILGDIENCNLEEKCDEKNTECMINLLLAFNLQFSNIETNIILKSLSNRDNAKVFTENLLILLNTEKDPIQVLELKKKPKKAVEKMLNDMLADSKTAKLFYMNDIEVLVDILLRRLLNLPSEERKVKMLGEDSKLSKSTNN
ncbi:NCK-interacting protein with SH3 domain isoform X2 [Daktulosphaira vitifoliae]|uniref:NCK-interacting protein with SH3 domain isoform X2 n=1 Tax=Daktulosphaira vitifoliae TaxID=58002 RepID=UPI0021AA776D|nr:NCK-interacting protein with SH3 domain isoform X2 [Daktulosphaira vitifoliae]